MCFDHDSRPPIPPIAGGSLVSGRRTLTAEDGATTLAAFARAERPTGAGVVVMPDIRGLHAYYADLALRFAEHGIDAVAVDWFGRTTEDDDRGPGFDPMPHVDRTTEATVRADVAAGAAFLRSAEGGGVRSVVTVGFCFGGRHAFLSATWGLGLSGVVGFYGQLAERYRNGSPAPADVADRMAAPVLGLFGGKDEGIPATLVRAFEASLTVAGVPHRLVTFEDAPHSFFDRKADEFVRSSEEAWERVLAFVAANTAPAA